MSDLKFELMKKKKYTFYIFLKKGVLSSFIM